MKKLKNICFSILLCLASFVHVMAQAKFIKQNEKNKAVIQKMLFSKVGDYIYAKLTKASDQQLTIPLYRFIYNGKKDLSSENILSSLHIDTAFASVLFFKNNKYLGNGVKVKDIDFMGGPCSADIVMEEQVMLKSVLKASSASKQYFYIYSEGFQQAEYFEILCYIEKGQLKFINVYKEKVHEFSNITDLINFRIGSVEKFWKIAEANKKNEKSMEQ